jgi:hypothetical protein
MNRQFALRSAWALAALPLLCGCTGGPHSSFAFTLRGGPDGVERVESSGDATGEINDSAELAIDDESWRLTMNLLGLDTGDQSIARGSGSVAILRKATGEVLSTDSGGSCTVSLEPHQSSNGSTVSGSFYCNGMGSPTGGAAVDVVGGTFQTAIDDPANNPGLP